jgi:hypothetical protein
MHECRQRPITGLFSIPWMTDKWPWNVCGVMIDREKRSIRIWIHPTTTLSTTNPARTAAGANLVLRSGKAATKHLIRASTAVCTEDPITCAGAAQTSHAFHVISTTIQYSTCLVLSRPGVTNTRITYAPVHFVRPYDRYFQRINCGPPSMSRNYLIWNVFIACLKF